MGLSLMCFHTNCITLHSCRHTQTAPWNMTQDEVQYKSESLYNQLCAPIIYVTDVNICPKPFRIGCMWTDRSSSSSIKEPFCVFILNLIQVVFSKHTNCLFGLMSSTCSPAAVRFCRLINNRIDASKTSWDSFTNESHKELHRGKLQVLLSEISRKTENSFSSDDEPENSCFICSSPVLFY